MRNVIHFFQQSRKQPNITGGVIAAHVYLQNMRCIFETLDPLLIRRSFQSCTEYQNYHYSGPQYRKSLDEDHDCDLTLFRFSKVFCYQDFLNKLIKITTIMNMENGRILWMLQQLAQITFGHVVAIIRNSIEKDR